MSRIRFGQVYTTCYCQKSDLAESHYRWIHIMQLCYVVTKSMLVQKYNSSDLCAKLWMKMGSICYKNTKLAHPSLQTMIHIVRVSCSLIDLPIVMHMFNYPHVADMYTHMWALLLLHDYLPHTYECSLVLRKTLRFYLAVTFSAQLWDKIWEWPET